MNPEADRDTALIPILQFDFHATHVPGMEEDGEKYI